jgi:hypothetical protein
MSQQQHITGSCLCGDVRFEITPPSTGFRYCHCSRCQKASGAAHAANLFLPEKQFKWLAGESRVKRFDLPGAKRFAVCFCTQCGTRVPHRITGTENMLIPAGLLDAKPDLSPESSIFWASKASWYLETTALPKFEEYSQ